MKRADKERCYLAHFHYIGVDAIVLLEITDKKTRETPKRVLDICRTRLARYKAV